MESIAAVLYTVFNSARTACRRLSLYLIILLICVFRICHSQIIYELSVVEFAYKYFLELAEYFVRIERQWHDMSEMSVSCFLSVSADSINRSMNKTIRSAPTYNQ